MQRGDSGSRIPDILIADDEPLMQKVLTILLQSAGYGVRKAQNGREALALIEENVPDLVLLDAHMPLMNGFETCQRLKADSVTADIPVIFMSGLSEADDIAQAFTLGAVDYIVKPFRTNEILAKVKSHLELRSLQLRLEDMCLARTQQLVEEVAERRRAEAALLESKQQLRLLSGHMEEAREAERLRIAGEIHDELGQSLTVARIDLARLKDQLTQPHQEIRGHIDMILKVLEQAMSTARAISENLRPGMLDVIGLGPAVENHVNRFSDMTGIRCELTLGSSGEFLADDKIAIAIFRILQEALTNVARHANANLVNVQLSEFGNEILLCVQDDGCGMPSPEMHREKGHYGLFGMSERAQLLGGDLNVHSTPGSGTRIEANLPIASPRHLR